MSFGGGWFFLAASESISVLNHHYALPGIGSYVATAIAQGNLGDVLIAIAVMIVMVIGVNFLFWRPVTAWAERFRVEESESAEKPRSLVLDVLRRSNVPELLGRPLRPAGRLLDRATRAVRRRRASPHGLPAARAHRGRVLRRGDRGGGRLRGVGGARLTCAPPPGWASSATRSRSVPLTFARVIFLIAVSHRGLGAAGRVDRDEPEGHPVRPAGRAGAGQLPGQLPLPVRYRSSSSPGTSRWTSARAADGARRPVVHPVQRHRRGLRDPDSTCARR